MSDQQLAEVKVLCAECLDPLDPTDLNYCSGCHDAGSYEDGYIEGAATLAAAVLDVERGILTFPELLAMARTPSKAGSGHETPCVNPSG